MDATETTVIGGISVIGGMFLNKFIEWFKEKNSADITKRQADSVIVKSEVEQAAAMYRDIIAGLRKDIEDVNLHMKQLELERLDCRESNASLRAELKGNQQTITNLENEVKELNEKITNLEANQPRAKK